MYQLAWGSDRFLSSHWHRRRRFASVDSTLRPFTHLAKIEAGGGGGFFAPISADGNSLVSTGYCAAVVEKVEGSTVSRILNSVSSCVR